MSGQSFVEIGYQKVKKQGDYYGPLMEAKSSKAHEGWCKQSPIVVNDLATWRFPPNGLLARESRSKIKKMGHNIKQHFSSPKVKKMKNEVLACI